MVGSYNLYWWHIKQYHQWSKLISSVRKHLVEEHTFDLIGFQECEDVSSIIHQGGLHGYDYYMGHNKPKYNPAPIAWRRSAFEKLTEPAQKVVAKDLYGLRLITYIRLRHLQSQKTVLFVNTHGPLNSCSSKMGQAWADGINGAAESGDAIIMTGDFNCARRSHAIKIVKDILPNGLDQNVDHVISNRPQVSGGTTGGYPSDHHFLYASFDVSSGEAASIEKASTTEEVLV